MKALNKHQKKAFMWYKVNELFSKGLNKTQIAEEIGVHRKTVRKYLNMTETEFHKWIERAKNLPKKLQDYYDYVRSLLETYPYLSASQVEDRLKENFNNLPQVHSKTVYNFVESIRKKHQIKKQADKNVRQYEKLPEPEYGQYAQVDFGEYHMLTHGVTRKKVYFFAMVLCRSRQKFVWFQTEPFTSVSTVRAHEKAFVYLQGQPHKIVYDQDRVLIVNENLGDILMTQEFHSYCQQMDFTPIFCRKSDPESKGKVENVIKYIKYNFLRGRIFIGEEELNKAGMSWLERTANSKEHAGIKKIPMQEWKIERSFLKVLRPSPVIYTDATLPTYKVRKDNTISYKSNFYTLPQGTYINPDTWVYVKETEEQVRIYDKNNYLLTIHPLCYQRGITIRNTDHTRDKSQSLSQLRENILQLFPDKSKGIVFIERIEKEKPRYLRDNLLVLKKHLPGQDPVYIAQALDFCIEANVYNSLRMIEFIKHFKQETENAKKAISVMPDIVINSSFDMMQLTPKTSKINLYENIL